MDIKAFFDEDTFTLTYVVWDPETRDAVIIDPVLGLDTRAWRIHETPIGDVDRFVRDNSLHVRWIMDTHAHADHISGMDVLKDRFGAPTAIGGRIVDVQRVFKDVYNIDDDTVPADGSQWDELLEDGQSLRAGSLEVEALHTPGHTPACMTYRVGDAVFTGDALFMPDYGTGRCDFPKGSAEDLFDSVTNKLYTLPESTRVFVGHDYLPGGRELKYETTIGESKERNVQLRAGTSRTDFVNFRRDRDATLEAPRLILQSLQVNIDAGRMPEPEDNGRRYLKMPLNFLGS
ncbi:MAG: MBL fold metallo-hydrolase [Myxococcota bacterium]